MGSLIAGWDSLSQDPKTVDLERNKSFTREEIESFHRSHKTSEHQHHQHEEVTSPQSFSISSSSQFLHQGSNGPIDVEKAHMTKALWTKSNWAFLNDPPEETQKSASNYAAQFHVAHVTRFPED